MVKLPTPKRMAKETESHRRAERQERKMAERLGGRRTRGSGSGYERGDVLVRGLVRVECKHTKHDSFRVTVEMIEKLEATSFGGEIPAIAIELSGGKRCCLVLPDWAVEKLFTKVSDAAQEPDR